MNVLSISYVKGISGTDKVLYDGKPQIAFIGRSNVGKSSMINSLAGRTIARSSRYPGRTKRLDMFLVNKSFYFVDLPGYGYAKIPGEQKERIRKMILWYLIYSKVEKRIVVLILDAKVGMMEFDRECLSILNEQNIPYVVIANKIDKIPLNMKGRILDEFRRSAGAGNVIPYSAISNKGRKIVFDELDNLLAPKISLENNDETIPGN